MVETLYPLDSFVVINKTILNDNDRMSLTILYQPIIGSIAVALYLTLWSFLDKNKITSLSNNHNDLIKSMQLKLEDIKEALEKLEGIGLIKAYVKKGEISNYIYELYGPLEPYEFLNNPILSTALYNNVDKKEYKRINDLFSLPNINLNGYKDISAKFKDVFSFMSVSKLENKNIKKTNHLDLVFEPTINFNELLSKIPEDLIKLRSITKLDKELIYNYAFIYNLDNDAMAEILLNSINNKIVDMDLLKENCRNYYRFENKGKIPKIVFQNQPEYLRQSNVKNTKKARLINQFETVSPYEFLSLKQDSKPTKKDMEIVEYLMIEQKLTPGVVNVLLDYVLKINNNKLIKSFVAQIAVQWKRSKIETVSDAIDIAIKEHNNKKTKQPKKNIEKVPNWMENEVTDDMLSEEELQNLERTLNND